MRRWLFNIVASLSLIICLAALALWARGWFVSDFLFRGKLNATRTHYQIVAIRTGDGRLVVVDTWTTPAPGAIAATHPWVGATAMGWTHQTVAPNTTVPDSFDFVFANWKVEDLQPGKTYVLGVRLLPLGAIMSVLPLLWLRRYRRTRRLRLAGHCTMCGYDLRASPERCRECGAPASISVPNVS